MELNKLSIAQLKKGKGPLWVLNLSKSSHHYGELLIEVNTPSKKKTQVTGKAELHGVEAWIRQSATGIVPPSKDDLETFGVETLVLPATWLPMCVTNIVPRQVLLRSENFVSAIEKGLIAVVDGNTASKLLNSEAGKDELDRLDKQQDARRFVETSQLVLVPEGYQVPRSTTDFHLHQTPDSYLQELLTRPPGVAKPLSEAPVEIHGVDYYEDEDDEDDEDDDDDEDDEDSDDDEDENQRRLDAEATLVASVKQHLSMSRKPWWKRLLGLT